MSSLNQDLARAHVAARLDDAVARQRGRRLACARRLSRKAEAAARRARLAAVRVL